jgi:Site-specific recombinase XerD
MLHIKKRGEIYHVFWYERKGDDRKARHRSKAISPLLEVAKVWAANKAAYIYAVKNNLPITNYSFYDFCDDYIADVTSTKRERTQGIDETIIKTFKRICPHVTLVEHFTDVPLSFFIKKRKEEKLLPSSINREIGVLKNMQSFAFKRNMFVQDYSKKTKFLAEKNSFRRYVPSLEEIQYLFDNVEEPIKTACILILWHSMRPGEACHTELTDFNWSDDPQNAYIRVQDKPHLNWYPKNDSSKRDIPINQDKDAELGLDIQKHLWNRYQAAKALKTPFICFYDDDGRQLTEGVLSSMITKLKNKKGSKLDSQFSPHKLRRAFVVKGGDTGKLLQAGILAGHSSIETTQQDYYSLTNHEAVNTMQSISFKIRLKSKDKKS